MVSWLRNLTYTGIAVGASWSCAVWRWRATNRMPDTADIVLWLLVLPLALLLAGWGGRALYRRATAAPAAAASAPEAAAVAASVPAPALPPLAIVASALRVPSGDGVNPSWTRTGARAYAVKRFAGPSRSRSLPVPSPAPRS